SAALNLFSLTLHTCPLRFGLQCGVCMREPQEPVELPCHHIYCLTCIKASLDAGQTSCPSCRQQLPNDFQPHVSEDTR
uniref:E3 ubiquitin-protein ligase n=1 Tax=Stegastes partitus TaxID=144197 RepID=A0A3B5A571_9TELE